MKVIVLISVLASQFVHANYNVGRPLGGQSESCGNLIYSGSASNVERHPLLRMPKMIQVLEGNERIDFNYNGWFRSWDSIISSFTSSQGSELIHNDVCFDKMEVVSCISYKSCSYRINAL